METLKTATGKTFETDYFNPCPPVQRCTIRLLKTNLAEVATVFGNPAETIQMWCGEGYATQYTRLIAIMPDDDAVRVVLGKE
jgi:hypothetical protein